jgi:hypothetical protein
MPPTITSAYSIRQPKHHHGDTLFRYLVKVTPRPRLLAGGNALRHIASAPFSL